MSAKPPSKPRPDKRAPKAASPSGGAAAPERPERIAKRIARAGVCSRRDAEKLIGEGRVRLNGQVLDTPAVTVTDRDRIEIDGKPLAEREPTRLWLYHKPAGLVTTNRDPQGRATLFERLPPDLPRVVTIGRLDINTEGLLLLTNDGGLARVLELPATGWLRRYRVRAHGSIAQERLAALADGIEIAGVRYGPIEATLDREQGRNVWLTMALREGKNREIKNVLEALGLSVNRLIRVSYGPFQLRDLAIGAVEEVKARVLRDQLGRRLAAEAGIRLPEETREAAPKRGPKREPNRQGGEATGKPKPRARSKTNDPAGNRQAKTSGAGHARRRRPV